MNIHFTSQALLSLKEALAFISNEISLEKQIQIKNNILSATDILTKHPKIGKEEDYLEHLNLGHRRIIEGNYKIIYRIEKQTIYITDIFDTRQSPDKMKGK